MRFLGIDPGARRTGLAVGDDELRVATPLQTAVHATARDLVARLCEVIARERVDRVVVGLPLLLDGREGESARRARALAEQLARRARVPVLVWDERLSTSAAERALRAQGVRGEARRAVVDQAAATLILQSYLDSERARTPASDVARGTCDPEDR